MPDKHGWHASYGSVFRAASDGVDANQQQQQPQNVNNTVFGRAQVASASTTQQRPATHTVQQTTISNYCAYGSLYPQNPLPRQYNNPATTNSNQQSHSRQKHDTITKESNKTGATHSFTVPDFPVSSQPTKSPKLPARSSNDASRKSHDTNTAPPTTQNLQDLLARYPSPPIQTSQRQTAIQQAAASCVSAISKKKSSLPENKRRSSGNIGAWITASSSTNLEQKRSDAEPPNTEKPEESSRLSAEQPKTGSRRSSGERLRSIASDTIKQVLSGVRHLPGLGDVKKRNSSNTRESQEKQNQARKSSSPAEQPVELKNRPTFIIGDDESSRKSERARSSSRDARPSDALTNNNNVPIFDPQFEWPQSKQLWPPPPTQPPRPPEIRTSTDESSSAASNDYKNNNFLAQQVRTSSVFQTQQQQMPPPSAAPPPQTMQYAPQQTMNQFPFPNQTANFAYPSSTLPQPIPNPNPFFFAPSSFPVPQKPALNLLTNFEQYAAQIPPPPPTFNGVSIDQSAPERRFQPTDFAQTLSQGISAPNNNNDRACSVTTTTITNHDRNGTAALVDVDDSNYRRVLDDMLARNRDGTEQRNALIAANNNLNSLIRALQNELNTLRGQLENVASENAQLRDTVSRAQAQAADERNALVRELAGRQQQALCAEGESKNAQKLIEQHRQQEDHKDKQIIQLCTQITTLMRHLEELKYKLDGSEAERCRELEQTRAQHESQLEQLRTAAESVLEEKEAQLNTLRNARASTDADAEQATRTIDELRLEIIKLQQNIPNVCQEAAHSQSMILAAQRENETLRSENARLQQTILSMRREFEETQMQSERHFQNLSTQFHATAQGPRELVALQNDVARLQTELNNANARIVQTERSGADMQVHNDTLTAQLRTLNTLVDELRAEKACVEQQMKEACAAAEQRQKKFNEEVAEMRRQFEREYTAKEQELSHVRHALNKIQQQIEISDRDGLQAMQVSQTWQAHAEQLENRLRQCQADNEKLERMLGRLRGESQRKTEEVESMREKMLQYETQNQQLESQTDALQQRASRVQHHNQMLDEQVRTLRHQLLDTEAARVEMRTKIQSMKDETYELKSGIIDREHARRMREAVKPLYENKLLYDNNNDTAMRATANNTFAPSACAYTSANAPLRPTNASACVYSTSVTPVLPYVDDDPGANVIADMQRITHMPRGGMKCGADVSACNRASVATTPSALTTGGFGGSALMPTPLSPANIRNRRLQTAANALLCSKTAPPPMRSRPNTDCLYSSLNDNSRRKPTSRWTGDTSF